VGGLPNRNWGKSSRGIVANMSHGRNKFPSVSHSHRKCSLPNACQKWIPEDKTTLELEPKLDPKTITIMMIIATIAGTDHRVGKDRLVGLGSGSGMVLVLGWWQCPHSEFEEWDRDSGRCILFLHCNCHLVAVSSCQSWQK